MNESLNNAMNHAWKEWHGYNPAIPSTNISFERGFESAVEITGPVIAELLEIIDCDCPVQDPKWMQTVLKAKILIKKNTNNLK